METARRMPASAAAAPRDPQMSWTGRTRGGYFGNWFFVQLVRLFGVWPAYFWLLFVAGYFALVGGSFSRASAGYFTHVFGPLPWWKRRFLVYRHFVARGVSLVDRLAVLMGRTQIECLFEGKELFAASLQQGKGILLLGAHLGCWELGGHFLSCFGAPVNIVVLEREVASIQRLLNSVTGTKGFRILTADDHPLRSIPILAALRRGEIVALLGDRTFGGADVETHFLGGKVRLPVGPYRLAAVSGAPLFHVFVIRERLGCYRFVALPPEQVKREEIHADPGAVAPYAQRYAERLEVFVRRYPFQWANFYPYWQGAPQPTSKHGPVPTSAPA